MRADRLRGWLLRWAVLLRLGALALPVLGLAPLGALWLYETGFLLWFAAANAGLLLAVTLILRLARRRAQAPAETPTHVPPGAEWTRAETAAFERAQARIAERVPEPLPWDALRGEAESVLATLAADFGRGDPAGFTLPEALLLTEQVSRRFRGELLRSVPFSDRLTVAQIRWVMRNRTGLLRAAGWGEALTRLGRAAANPPGAVLGEIGRLATGEAKAWLLDKGAREIQILLLEEVARAGVDLYSGRLRYSEEELRAREGRTEVADAARRAQPMEPPRILVIGQTSAGKSSLVNALAGRAQAETGAPPTTGELTVHDLELDGVACRLVDGPGTDAPGRAEARLLAEMAQADMILWAVAADRPGREPDRRLLDAFRAWVADHPDRVAPPILPVATRTDRLDPEGWERRAAQGFAALSQGHPIRQALVAIAGDLPGLPPPVAVRAAPPAWNLGALRRAMERALDAAINAQHNRRRVEGEAAGRPRLRDIPRIWRGARSVVRRLAGRTRG